MTAIVAAIAVLVVFNVGVVVEQVLIRRDLRAAREQRARSVTFVVVQGQAREPYTLPGHAVARAARRRS